MELTPIRRKTDQILKRMVILAAFVFNYLRRSQVRVLDIAILLTAFLGAAHMLIRTSNYGPEWDHDSFDYISTAENLIAGNGFEDFLERPYAGGGPVYPLLLAFFGPLGIDPVDTGRFINIIGFGLIILLTGYQLKTCIKIRILAWIGSVAVMTSYTLSLISTHLMTDTLYMLIMLLALIQMWKFLKSEGSPRSLALSAGFTALAIATRYVGVAILFTGIILILMKRGFKISRKLGYTALYGIISLIPLGIWMIRDSLSSGIFGQFDSYQPQSSLMDYLKHFSNLFISLTLPLRSWGDGFIYLFVTVTCLIIWRITQRRKHPNTKSNAILSISDSQSYGLSFLLFGLFSLISLVILILVMSNLSEAYQLPDRHLLAIYMSVIIMALVLLDLLLHRLARKQTTVYLILVCLISTGILVSISLSVRLNIDRARALATYTQPELFEIYGYSRDMELFSYLRSNPVDGQIYSNGNILLYQFTDLPLENVIRDDGGGLYSCIAWIQELSGFPEPSYIVYLTDYPTELEKSLNYCNIPEIEFNPNVQGYLERIVETPEGTVYRATRPPGLPGPANFDVQYGQDNTLIYTKEECTHTDTELYFFLHITPVDMSVLSGHHANVGFDNLDFYFQDHGIIYNSKCTATIELPHYDISKIRTGQKTRIGAKLWETELQNTELQNIDRAPELFEIYGYSRDMELFSYLRSNPVDGQIYSNGNILLYQFTDLPLENVIRDDGGGLYSCIAWIQELSGFPEPSYIVYLTDYPTELEKSLNYCNIPEIEFNPNVQGYLERIVETPEGTVYRATRPPGLPGPANFDVQYGQDNTLIYTKEECTHTDTELYFFLHITPVDVNVLSNDVVFDNFDFHFDDHGTMRNSKCTATIELPHYDISKITTGQKTGIGAKLWETELPRR